MGVQRRGTSRHAHSEDTAGAGEDGRAATVEVEEHESEPEPVHHHKHKKHHKKRFPKDSKRFIFVLGAVIGILFAVYFGAKPDMASELDKYVTFETLQDYFDDWKDILPSGLQNIITDVTNRKPGDSINFSEDFAVGKAMVQEQNLKAKHPVIMIPGVISTGLESWSIEGTKECPSQAHFRKRLWGSMYMLRTMFLDKACWLKHIMLDEKTGLDPEGIRIRSAQGFEAADFFITGYWIWNKILQNLSVIGYEPNKMVTAAYDWRLSYLDLERRDKYFSILKAQVEIQHSLTGEKAVLVAHSMGSQVAYYFMKWVEAEGEHFGNGGPTWVNDHIDSFIDISGSLLGAPKAIPALLSGEMKDTVQLNALAVYGLEKFFSRRERLDMLRTFGGIASMLPKGGDVIWGNPQIGSVEDQQANITTEGTFGKFISFDKAIGTYSQKNLSLSESIDFILDTSPKWFSERTMEHYSYGMARTKEELEQNNQDFSKWSNPLEAALPNAPDLKVYSFYGVGKLTERAYIYQEEENKESSRLNISIAFRNDGSSVFFTDGDGTLPTITHAISHLWKNSSSYNPGNSTIKIVEMKHDPDRFDIRGGAKTAEHVDILGSAELNEMVLKVAAGRHDLINERIITNMTNWVNLMDIPLKN